MSKPLPVTIIRPKASFGDAAGNFLSSAITLTFRAWLVMLLVPHFTPWHLSFWQSVAACLVIGTLVSDESYMLWSKGGAS
jgi:hypothetical protein